MFLMSWKLPIPFATILVETDKGTAADESGHFYLELPPGTVVPDQCTGF